MDQFDDDSCSASEAIAYLAAHGLTDAERQIHQCLESGALHACGYYSYRVEGGHSSEWARYLERIPTQFWKTRSEILDRFLTEDQCDDDDWHDGWANDEFWTRHTVFDKFETPTRYFQSATNVRFAYAELDRLWKNDALAPGVEPVLLTQAGSDVQNADANKGGKPAAKHGDVIAAMTLRLVGLPAQELARYTTDSLARELADEYVRLGLAALALLSQCPDLPLKPAGFLGHVCVAAVLTEKQRDWLDKLLDRYGLPPLAD